MKRPPNLASGDKIGIAAPARKVSPKELEIAFQLIRDHGFGVFYDSRLFAAEHQFAGNDQIRANYLQQLLDEPEVKAIFMARGGYGSVRIIDRLDFHDFKHHPKWLVGYSDMTVFHSHINRNLGIQTLHGSMLLNFAQNSQAALEGLFDVLSGSNPEYAFSPHPLNRTGKAEGQLTGGNLSVLYSLIGSRSLPDFREKILFLEDLDEYLYHIDRMMTALKRAGVFEKIRGLIVGGMTEMNDNEIPFGQTAEEIVAEAVQDYEFPVCFHFPAGHIPDNRPLIMGGMTKLSVGDPVVVKQ